MYLHNVSSCSPTATSVIAKPIWCCVIDIMPYQKRQKGKFLPMTQQHAGALWKACSAGEASLAWQKALGVRTLSSVIDLAKLALAGGMHGKRWYPPKTL
jgi:hypothetical protein